MSAPTLSETNATIGSFTAEAFAAHLASLPPLPSWWLDRKRAAYEKFTALPMPSATDETWRFSNRSTLTLDGFHLPSSAASAAKPHSPIGITKAAKLVFVNGRLDSREPLAAGLAQRGVIVDTLQNALNQHGDLVRRSIA